MSGSLRVVNPAELPPPRGFSHGVQGTGELLFVAGQIGTDAQGSMVGPDFVTQFGQALDNVLAVVRAAGGAAWDIAEMTVYVTDLPAYRAGAKSLGAIWKERMGKHYPAMALVEVKGLLEDGAKVEIEGTAVL